MPIMTMTEISNLQKEKYWEAVWSSNIAILVALSLRTPEADPMECETFKSHQNKQKVKGK